MQHPIVIRKATIKDVPDIVLLLADDILGSTRESRVGAIAESYYRAFHAIEHDPNQQLVVAECAGKTVGTLQMTYLFNMSFQGARRAMIEGVHVTPQSRNQGVGQHMMEWAIAQAKQNGCWFVQLTSHKQRGNAHRFYERLGFIASHKGFKLALEAS